MPCVPAVVRRSRVLMVLLGRERVAKVPDRVRQRAVLRDQQQKRAQEVQC